MATEKNKISDNFEDFKEWFANPTSGFIIRNGGYYPKKWDRWYDKVEKTHQDIRKLFGGVRLERKISLESHQSPITEDEAQPIVSEIIKIVPEYLREYDYSPKIFLLPTMGSGTHNAIKVSKHVRGYAEAIFKYENKEKLTNLDKLLSKLGGLWARSKTTKSELDVTISTSAKSFALLGHYGPDQDSCFRQNSDRTREKYILGQTTNTFVASIQKLDEKKNKQKNVARCFGFVSNKNTAINLSNYYFINGFPEGDAIDAFRTVFEELLGDKVEFHEGKNQIPDIFANPYGRWSFSKGNGSKLTMQTLACDMNGISFFLCPKCGREATNDDSWEEIDGEYYCQYCVARANRCEVTKKVTFKPLTFALVGTNNDAVMVHPDYAETLHSCNLCNAKHENCIEINDKIICNDCFEAQFTQCDECDMSVEDRKIVPFGTRDICISCFDNGVSPFEDDEISEFLSARRG